PGQTWADYIEEKLARCKVMIVLWSAVSTKSQWVREEARMGRDKGRLIPVMLDESSPPFGFGEVQAANLASWRGEAHHPEWQRFVGAVQRAVGAPSHPASPLPPPASFAPPAPPPSGSADEAQSLSPIGYIQKCFRLYVNAKGRARRAEFWWFVLFEFVAILI